MNAQLIIENIKTGSTIFANYISVELSEDYLKQSKSTLDGLFLEQAIFLPPEYFESRLKYKSSIFSNAAMIAFFVEKTYLYDLKNANFTRTKRDSDFDNFLRSTDKNQNFYERAIVIDSEMRSQEFVESLTSKSNNLTSLDEIPEIFLLKTNKAALYWTLKLVSEFTKEFIFMNRMHG